jgi:hypothetical protein
MGYLEFLVHFYIMNTAFLVKLSDFNFDPLIYHPAKRTITNENRQAEWIFVE